MSGRAATESLRKRFEAICQSELKRRAKRIRHLAPHQQRCVESIASEVVLAIVGVPERVLASGATQRDVEALTLLFALDR